MPSQDIRLSLGKVVPVPRPQFGPTFEINLRFERGEVTIDYQTTPAYVSQVKPLVEEGKAVPVISMGFIDQQGRVVRDPGQTELPSVYEAYQTLYNKKPDGLLKWKAYRAILAAGFSFQKTFWVWNDTPPEVLRTLHQAVDAMSKDPQFQAQAKDALEGYTVQAGNTAEAAVRRSFLVTLDVTKYIKNLLQTKYGVRF